MHLSVAPEYFFFKWEEHFYWLYKNVNLFSVISFSSCKRIFCCCPLVKKGFLDVCSENLQKTGQQLFWAFWPFSMSCLIYAENSTWNCSKHPQALRINAWDFLLPLQLSLSFFPPSYHAWRNFVCWEDTQCFHCSARHFPPLFWTCKKWCLAERTFFFSASKYNTGLLLAIGPDLSTLGFLLNKSG